MSCAVQSSTSVVNPAALPSRRDKPHYCSIRQWNKYASLKMDDTKGMVVTVASSSEINKKKPLIDNSREEILLRKQVSQYRHVCHDELVFLCLQQKKTCTKLRQMKLRMVAIENSRKSSTDDKEFPRMKRFPILYNNTKNAQMDAMKRAIENEKNGNHA